MCVGNGDFFGACLVLSKGIQVDEEVEWEERHAIRLADGDG